MLRTFLALSAQASRHLSTIVPIVLLQRSSSWALFNPCRAVRASSRFRDVALSSLLGQGFPVVVELCFELVFLVGERVVLACVHIIAGV